MPNRRLIVKEGECYGYMTCISEFGKGNNGHITWLCKCSCGKEKVVKVSSLLNGNTVSCGCKKVSGDSNRIHGKCRHPLYKSWSNIKKRCYYDKKDNYSYYGGRGIRVCDEWKNDFMAFFSWAIDNGWEEGLTIDRKDYDGDYSPSNSKWVTMIEQANNKSNNRKLVYNGVEMNLCQISRANGIKPTTIMQRITKGWSEYDAVHTPVFSKPIKSSEQLLKHL